MQQDIGSRPELLVQGQHVAIRIGCHFGPVVLEHKDIFGASVHTANRMTSQAKAGQIILSAETLRRCSPEWRATSRRVDVTSLRGLNEEIELYEVLWQQEDATSMLPSIAMGGMHGARQRARSPLRAGDRPGRCTQRNHDGTRGREQRGAARPADLSHPREDRTDPRPFSVGGPEHQRHVRAERRRQGSVRSARLVALLGAGFIGLGKQPDPNAPDVIRYELED